MVRDTGRMLAGLLEAGHIGALEQMPSLIAKHAAYVGLHEVLIYLTDLQQQVLRLLPAGDADTADKPPAELRIGNTVAGRGFMETRIVSRPGAEGEPDHWWIPLLDGTERLGMLRVSVRDADDTDLVNMRALASLAALLVASKRSHSDSYARLVRTRPMHVAAEMQWKLMPPLTFAHPEVVICAAMEPAYEVGGDAYDYAIAGDVAHLGIFDAMGHDVSAGLTASLAVAACRNNRRQDLGLAENTVNIEEVLISEFGRGTRFVTAILADLDTSTGMLSWVNRGHHPPVVIRGGRWTTSLTCPPAHPMGMGLDLPVVMCREQLEPGDRVLLYTDGITEARSAGGREFGLSRFVDFIIRHTADGLAAPETLRRLVHGVLDYHDGLLQDDATVLLVEWQGATQSRLTITAD
ncbi:PP2C family protein-serine/threonine phosphatase [Nonomuraea sp. NPDC050328]|uniref:PP2C family protein-serine/threonine phosphatase n=1 Tax=Nonomuraea sp. NPDC050328 TaxID=3364361 RepID=UPI0037B305A0